MAYREYEKPSVKKLAVYGFAYIGAYYVGRLGYFGPQIQGVMWSLHRAFELNVFGIDVGPTPPPSPYGGY